MAFDQFVAPGMQGREIKLLGENLYIDVSVAYSGAEPPVCVLEGDLIRRA